MQMPVWTPAVPRDFDQSLNLGTYASVQEGAAEPAGDAACHAACAAGLTAARSGCAALGPFAPACLAAAEAAFLYCNTRC